MVNFTIARIHNHRSIGRGLQRHGRTKGHRKKGYDDIGYERVFHACCLTFYAPGFFPCFARRQSSTNESVKE
jgi:hypothetical protein